MSIIIKKLNRIYSIKILRVILKGLLGALLLCGLSFFQKIIIGANPFILKGYIIPPIFGLITGFFIGNYIEKIKDLNKRLKSRVNNLEHLLPICSVCKKIRKPNSDPANEDSWVSIEDYISNELPVDFSHGICLECMKKLYGDINSRKTLNSI